VSRRQGGRRQGTVLIVGFAVRVLMLVVVVVDASAAFLRRQHLDTLADGAALAAADGVAGEQVYTQGLDDRASIDPAEAARLAAEHLVVSGAIRRYPGLRHTVDVDAERVVVRLTAPLDLPLPLPGVVGRTWVSGTAAAVVAVGD
jgi:uncharacterized membrane protein